METHKRTLTAAAPTALIALRTSSPADSRRTTGWDLQWSSDATPAAGSMSFKARLNGAERLSPLLIDGVAAVDLTGPPHFLAIPLNVLELEVTVTGFDADKAIDLVVQEAQ